MKNLIIITTTITSLSAIAMQPKKDRATLERIAQETYTKKPSSRTKENTPQSIYPTQITPISEEYLFSSYHAKSNNKTISKEPIIVFSQTKPTKQKPKQKAISHIDISNNPETTMHELDNAGANDTSSLDLLSSFLYFILP